MSQKKFDKKLVERRLEKGLTQEELAARCSVTKRTIQRIESGVVNPRSFTIKRLSEILDFDFLGFLISNEEINEFDDSAIKNAHQYYLIDLFNLKTDTMKKITILTIFLSFIILGLSVLLNFGNAQESQNTNKNNSNFRKQNAWWNPILAKHGFTMSESDFNIVTITEKNINGKCSNIKAAFNQGDTAIYIVIAPKGEIRKNHKNYTFLNGSDFRYFRNGDVETGKFDKISIKM